jgi:hypothetical protein
MADTLYEAACVYALSAAAASDNASLAGQYADRAVALLRQALKKDPKAVGAIPKEARLDRLRSREDFHQLIENWKKQEPEKGNKEQESRRPS